MIDYVNEMVGHNQDSMKVIKRWVVGFQTPFGLIDNLKQAVERCKQSDLDPQLMIIPIPVAESETYYESVTRS